MSKIHKSARVAPGAVVGPDVIIGEGCLIGSGAQLLSRVELGVDNKVWPGAMLGGEPQDVHFDSSEETWLRVGDGNEFRENVVIHRGSPKEDRVTRVGNGNYFMAFSHAGHDCVIEDHCIFANNVMIAGHCHIQSGANFGGAAAVAQFVTVGRLAFVAGMNACRKDLEPFMVHSHGWVGGSSRPLIVNKVGLERAGVTRESILQLRKVHKLLFRGSRCDVEAARAEIGSEIAGEVEELFDFVLRMRSGRNGIQKRAQ